MATPATLNRWLDELSASILKQESSVKEPRKIQEVFRKCVRRHNYGRTNQFEVIDRLNGLEEKFQILALDNLSDALRQRRIELKDFELNWLPDVLDFFLHLSGEPARNQNLLDLYSIPKRVGTPPPLRWKDVLADSPINKRDRLWRVPEFYDTDDSGYDDESSLGKSGAEDQKPKDRQDEADSNLDTVNLYSFKQKSPGTEHKLFPRLAAPCEISESRLIREVLFVLKGYDSEVLVVDDGKYSLQQGISVRNISSHTLNAVVSEVLAMREDLDVVQQWLGSAVSEPYIAVAKHETESVIESYHRDIDQAQTVFTDPTEDSVISIIPTMYDLRPSSEAVAIIASLVRRTQYHNSIAFVESLYDEIQTAQICDHMESYTCLSSILIQSLRVYLEPILIWLDQGTLESESFFVAKRGNTTRSKDLWHDTFALQETGRLRPPDFLKASVSDILACGKTSAFLRNLLPAWHTVNLEPLFLDCLRTIEQDSVRPLSAAFESHWNEQVSNLLQSRTALVKDVLDAHCGIENTFDIVAQLYLRLSSPILNDFEVKMFEQIDRCIDSWNDRFQIKDMLEDTLSAEVAQSIVVHSTYTSSRTMQSRRTSVRLLNSLALDFVLPWSLANIIRHDTMTAYKRIALMLVQIRRARYCLERIGFASAFSVPLGDDSTTLDQRAAQVQGFTLLAFVNGLYDHLMTATIVPLTQAMRDDMHKALTIDDMIQVHGDYICRLEFACLTATKFKTLRQTLTAILDLCIRYSDLVSNPSKVQNFDSDHEASSFISARSRNKRLRADQNGTDSEDEDEGHFEGYSSFIVLDEDTSIVKELGKVKLQFKKQLTLLTAGLRIASKSVMHRQDLVGLADRLSWLDIHQSP